jgi:Tfp pilus assembly protein FimT
MMNYARFLQIPDRFLGIGKFAGLSSKNGYSLIETSVLLAIVGVASAIGIPNMTSMLADYRLNVASRQLSTAIQYTRGKAVAENYNFTIRMNPDTASGSDAYQIAGGEVDVNGNGLDPWEDRNNNGIQDTMSFAAKKLPKGIRYIPPGTPVSSSPSISSLSLTYPNTGTASISFNPMGQETSANNSEAVYLQNERGAKAAVTVDSAGKVQVWRFRDSQWVAQ